MLRLNGSLLVEEEQIRIVQYGWSQRADSELGSELMVHFRDLDPVTLKDDDAAYAQETLSRFLKRMTFLFDTEKLEALWLDPTDLIAAEIKHGANISLLFTFKEISGTPKNYPVEFRTIADRYSQSAYAQQALVVIEKLLTKHTLQQPVLQTLHRHSQAESTPQHLPR